MTRKNVLYFNQEYLCELASVVKKATIVISLVEESATVSNEDIKKEILNELSKELAKIPWLKEVEKITISED
jgi:hypothetical protein